MSNSEHSAAASPNEHSKIKIENEMAVKEGETPDAIIKNFISITNKCTIWSKFFKNKYKKLNKDNTERFPVLLLEDTTFRCRRPCVLDIKLGTDQACILSNEL